MKQKIDKRFELRRQTFHACFGVAIVLLYYFNIITFTILLYVFIIGAVLSFISVKKRIPLLCWFLDRFERHGAHPGRGVLTYLIGALLVIKLFPKDIALASIMILALGDSIAHYLGRFYGKTKSPLHEIKLFEGTVFGIIAATIGATFFICWVEALIASLFAMIVEAYEWKLKHFLLDDNILIPLIAGVVIYVVRMLMVLC